LPTPEAARSFFSKVSLRSNSAKQPDGKQRANGAVIPESESSVRMRTFVANDTVTVPVR